MPSLVILAEADLVYLSCGKTDRQTHRQTDKHRWKPYPHVAQR